MDELYKEAKHQETIHTDPEVRDVTVDRQIKRNSSYVPVHIRSMESIEAIEEDGFLSNNSQQSLRFVSPSSNKTNATNGNNEETNQEGLVDVNDNETDFVLYVIPKAIWDVVFAFVRSVANS